MFRAVIANVIQRQHVNIRNRATDPTTLQFPFKPVMSENLELSFSLSHFRQTV
jgi:hypothetical protein